jgi:hypothetical protein
MLYTWIWLTTFNLDSNLYSTLLKDLPNGIKYTVIFTTTKVEKVMAELLSLPEYEPEFAIGSVVKMDLKRDLRVRGDNGTRPDLRPLFEKYQFFNPGMHVLTPSLFMPWIRLRLGLEGDMC